MKHHRLDPYPIPEDKTPLYINEPWLIDKSLLEHLQHREPEEQPDNIRIYDQMWFIRHMPEEGKHSQEAKELVREIITRLEQIPDGCAECFPFEVIDELKQEYY